MSAKYPKKLSFLLCMCLSYSGSHVYGLNFSSDLQKARWDSQSSVFECRISQNIPVFGEAVFSHRAGETLEFFVRSTRDLMAEGDAAVVMAAPEWNPNLSSVSLGVVEVDREAHRISLPESLSSDMLSGLARGYAPEFVRKPWYSDNDVVRVSVSPARFLPAYEAYQTCLIDLLPVNFSQISRSRFSFGPGKSDLAPEDYKRLDLVVRYVKADKDVNAIFVDGYTDSTGLRMDNEELSRLRAKAVSRYLLEQGIPSEYIATRYHGEHYPVAKNNSSANRALNRRVTVRLEKLPDRKVEEILDKAMARREKPVPVDVN